MDQTTNTEPVTETLEDWIADTEARAGRDIFEILTPSLNRAQYQAIRKERDRRARER